MVLVYSSIESLQVVHGRSGSVALFLWNVVLANAALFVADGAVVRRAERRALFLSIVVDMLAFQAF